MELGRYRELARSLVAELPDVFAASFMAMRLRAQARRQLHPRRRRSSTLASCCVIMTFKICGYLNSYVMNQCEL